MRKIGKIRNGVFTPYANMSGGVNSPITFEQATELANVQSGDSMSVALGKLSKLYETLESGSASTLLGESLEANRIMETDGGGKVATSGLPRDRLDNLKILIFDSTRTELLESGNVGATYFLTNTNTPADELPSGAPEWKYAGGLLIKRTNMIASIVIYGYWTGNTAITTTGDGGQTWSSYKNVQEQVGSLEAALNATNFNFKLKKYVDTECSSHIEVLQKYWNEAFEDVPAAGGYRIILTNYGSANVVWTCYAYQNKLYGYALCFSHPNNDVSSPQYYTISNGTWTKNELITYNEFNPVAQNVKCVKTWSVSEWTKAGGNLPVNNGTGAIMRMQGYTNPGETKSSDSYYLYHAYTNNNTCQLYIGLNVTTGNYKVTWYQLAQKSDCWHIVYKNEYYGLALPDGTDTGWVRTPSPGLLPYQAGGASSLGTSSWPFNYIYGKNIYENGQALSARYAGISHSHSYLPTSHVINSLSDIRANTTSGKAAGALGVKELSTKANGIGDMVLIGETASTNYQAASFTRSLYKGFLLVTSRNGTQMGPLASTVIPVSLIDSIKDNGSSAKASFGAEPSNYQASCYFSGTNAYIKSNSSFDTTRLYGIRGA